MALGRRTSGHDLRTFAAFGCQNITQEGLEVTMKLSFEQKYDAVLNAIPKWQPTFYDRSFGIASIKKIVPCTLPEAVEIREKLEYYGAIPQRKW